MRQLTWPASTEPSIREVLNDPMVRQMMACDNVRDEDLVDLIEAVRHKRAVRVWRGGGPDPCQPPLDELSGGRRDHWQRRRTMARALQGRAQ
jgi:hypothetical protein